MWSVETWICSKSSNLMLDIYLLWRRFLPLDHCRKPHNNIARHLRWQGQSPALVWWNFLHHIGEMWLYVGIGFFSVIHYQDAIFQRLVEDRFFQSVPSIIITAKGYPDLASRYLDYCWGALDVDLQDIIASLNWICIGHIGHRIVWFLVGTI